MGLGPRHPAGDDEAEHEEPLAAPRRRIVLVGEPRAEASAGGEEQPDPGNIGDATPLADAATVEAPSPAEVTFKLAGAAHDLVDR
eukprot:6773811-Karenia_brevis.AAC.1